MIPNSKEDAFYKRLHQELERTSSWPSDYLFKFIVLSDPEKEKQVLSFFDNTGAVIQTKKSSNAKYTSLSITVNLPSPEAVIAKYKQVSVVEGIISL